MDFLQNSRAQNRRADELVSLAAVDAGNIDGWAAVSRSRLPKPPFTAQNLILHWLTQGLWQALSG
jgi:hypothetical protein